jgi:ryanodine receptor 2
MTERSGALQEDPLYMSYAQIIAKSCGEEEEEGGEEEPAEGGGEEEAESGASIHVSIVPSTNLNTITLFL